MTGIPQEMDPRKERDSAWDTSSCRRIFRSTVRILDQFKQKTNLGSSPIMNILCEDYLKEQVVKQVIMCTKGQMFDQENAGIVWYTKGARYHPSTHPATAIEVKLKLDLDETILDIDHDESSRPTSTTFEIDPLQKKGVHTLSFWHMYFNLDLIVNGTHFKVNLRDILLYKVMKVVSRKQKKHVGLLSILKEEMLTIFEEYACNYDADFLRMFKDYDQVNECMKSLKKKFYSSAVAQNVHISQDNVVHSPTPHRKERNERFCSLLDIVSEHHFHFVFETTDNNWRMEDHINMNNDLKLICKESATFSRDHGISSDFINFLGKINEEHERMERQG